MTNGSVGAPLSIKIISSHTLSVGTLMFTKTHFEIKKINFPNCYFGKPKPLLLVFKSLRSAPKTKNY